MLLAACNAPETSSSKTTQTPTSIQNTPVISEPESEPTPEPEAVPLAEPEPIAPELQTIGGYVVDIARDCDGYPRMKLATPEGLCVGLVVSKETPAKDGKAGLIFPRDIVFPRPDHQFNQEFYLTDMGGWGENKGRVLLVDVGQIETVMDGLMLPHAIEYGPDGQIYVAEADTLISFEPPPAKTDGFGYKREIINLPYKPGGAKHLHPLKAFTFSDANELWLNSGSLSDRCLDSLNFDVCTEARDAGTVLNFRKDGNLWTVNPDKIAFGLRNSMGLTTHSSGTVLQVENGADFEDANSPFEEINRLDILPSPRRFYGWPYCFDRDEQDPDWGAKINYNCSTYNPDYRFPIALLPPHGAPLDLLYAPEGILNFEQEKLILPLHGYREGGHRILYFDVDEEGLPIGDAQELVFDWDASDTGPRGAPVGLTIGPDRAIWGVEDKNKTVFRVSVDKHLPQAWNDTSITTIVKVEETYPTLHAEIFKPKCAACHVEFTGSAQASYQALHRVGWLGPESILYERLLTPPPKQMPPDQPLPQPDITKIKDWLETTTHR